MYFLSQLKTQFFHNIFSRYADAQGELAYEQAAGVGSSEVHEDFSQDQISSMSSSEILVELKERLDTVKAGEKIVGTRADVLMRFCMKVKNNEVHGYTTADADYKRLVEMVHSAVVEYRGLAGEAAEIDEKIQVELARIGGRIDKEIADPDENTVLDEDGEKQQQELNNLETQRESLVNIPTELLSNAPEGFESLNSTTQVITQINNLGAQSVVGSVQDKVSKMREINSEIQELLQSIDIEDEISLHEIKMEETSILGELHKRIDRMASSEDDNQKAIAMLNLFYEKFHKEGDEEMPTLMGYLKVTKDILVKYPEEGISEGDRVRRHSELLKISSDISATIDAEKTEGNDSVILTEAQITEIEVKTSTEREKFNALVLSIQGKISTANSQELLDLENPNLNQELKDKIIGFGSIHSWEITEGSPISEQLVELQNKNIELGELDFDIEKLIRDEAVVGENGEKLGEVRKTLIEQKFQEIKENGTQVQKDIIGDTDFKDLTSDKFGALAENGADLSEFLLVDNQGKAFTGNFEDGQEFIMNAGGNTEIGGYLSGYIFDMQHVEMITISGVEYTRDITTTPSPGFKDGEGNPIGIIRDGTKITISKTQSISDDDFTPIEERLRRSFTNDRTAAIMTDIYGEYETMDKSNGFKWEDLWKALISGDLVGIAEQLEHIMEGRFHIDPETGGINVIDPANPDAHYPVTEADMSLASLSSFPASYRRNLIQSAGRAGISPDAFVSQMNQECESNGFPPQRFIALIGHESGWKSWAQNPTSSAYGLGQMIDSTWSSYANGGNRNNPLDQMKASVRYLKHIMNYRNCAPEDACAFYNTGEGFRIDNSPAPSSYISQNGVIVDKIPRSVQSNGITRREYFLGAVAYYNDISFAEANSRSKFGNRS